MAEIEFTIPTVQYGNVKVRATPEELGIDNLDAYSVGVSAAAWLNLATQGFEYGKTLDLVPDHVTGQYQESSENPPLADWEKEMLKPASEQAESEIKDQLGATTVEPWTKTPAPTTTPKAWDDFNI